MSHHEVIDPGGNPGVYGVIHFKNIAVGVVPLDVEINTWIVGQYRYPLEAYSWEMPEGGGKRDVPAVESAKRELREEAGVIARGDPVLLSLHSNERFFPGDHVAVFRIDAFDQGPRASQGEIAEIGWFHPSALPDDAHRSTRARLAEIFDAAPVSHAW